MRFVRKDKNIMNTSEYLNSLRERLEAAGKRLEEWNNLPSLQATSYNGLKKVDSIMGEIYTVGDELKQIKDELDAIEQG